MQIKIRTIIAIIVNNMRTLYIYISRSRKFYSLTIMFETLCYKTIFFSHINDMGIQDI